MNKKRVYLKAEQNVKVDKDKVYVGDLFKITCRDNILVAKLKVVLLFDFARLKKKRTVVSILKVINMLENLDDNIEIVSMGENDIVVEKNDPKKQSKVKDVLKIIFVSLICFFGTAFTIMAFHNDIDVTGLFERTYRLVGLPSRGGLGPLEFGYSIGLGGGIIVFYNHIGKRRLTTDPTPLEVEMKIYEDDVNKTLIESADREGIELDVDL